MNKDAQQVIDMAVGVLVADLKAGKSDTMKEWMQSVSKFHSYSWSNSLLILFQTGGKASRVMGARQWETNFNRKVKDGENGVSILAPVIVKRNKDAKKGTPEAEQKKLIGFRLVKVFAEYQTEGDALPEFARPTGSVPEGALDKLIAFSGKNGVPVNFDSRACGEAFGFYSVQSKSITIREGMSEAETFAVVSHEIGHSILHANEARRKQTSRTVRELEAEAVSFIVSTAVGVSYGRAASDYIQLYAGDEKLLTESLSHIVKAAHSILGAVQAEGVRELVAA